MEESTIESKQLVRSYGDIWDERDYSKIPDIVSESFVLYDPSVPKDEVPGPKGEAHGPEGLEAFIRWLDGGFPDFQLTIIDLLASEDMVMDEVMFTGTHDGPLGGLPPTGRKVGIKIMSKIRVEDGKVQEQRVYINQQEFASQLGLTFPAILGQLPKLVLGKLRRSR